MAIIQFPVIDPVATGANITRPRRERGFTVRDLQQFFGFEEPQAIYKWQRGQSLPSIDNLYALSALLHISMNEILVPSSHIDSLEQQAAACCSNHITAVFFRAQGVWQSFSAAQALIRPAPAAPLRRTAEGTCGIPDDFSYHIPQANLKRNGDVLADLGSERICGGQITEREARGTKQITNQATRHILCRYLVSNILDFSAEHAAS